MSHKNLTNFDITQQTLSIHLCYIFKTVKTTQYCSSNSSSHRSHHQECVKSSRKLHELHQRHFLHRTQKCHSGDSRCVTCCATTLSKCFLACPTRKRELPEKHVSNHDRQAVWYCGAWSAAAGLLCFKASQGLTFSQSISLHITTANWLLVTVRGFV